MKSYIKLAVPAIALASIALFLRYTEKAPVEEQAEIIINQSASSPAYQQLNLDEDVLVSSEEVNDTPGKNETIHEVLVFNTTEEYEAASRYGDLPSLLSDIALERFR